MNLASSSNASGTTIKVMIVDDSAVLRGILTKILEPEASIEVVTTASNGQIAVNEMKRRDIDVVVLDIEMPVMDGLTALPLMLEESPHSEVIIASTLTHHNAEISLKALELGAADYLAKPSTGREIGGAEDFQRDLISKVKALGREALRKKGKTVSTREKDVRKEQIERVRAPASPPLLKKEEIVTHPNKHYKKPDVIAIGSSTGGPQALFTLMKGLRNRVRQPIVITQHMPPKFTEILANHISQQSGLEACEGKDGIVLEGGKVYVAPGNYHMTFKKRGSDTVIVLNQDAPVNYCRPAVDVMLDSLISLYGDKILSVILTGMGHDGREGCKTLFERGGAVLAQDEQSSVVWGMPGAVAQAGVCKKILPIDRLADAVVEAAQ